MEKRLQNQIAIDGPAASGKSSVTKAVAKKLKWSFLSSGRIYRSIAASYWLIHREQLKHNQVLTSLEDFIKMIKISAVGEDILIDGKKSDLIFADCIEQTLKMVAANQSVRTIVNNWIRSYVSGRNMIVEGRDIGSQVLPNAFLKLYLDADLKIRALRRFEQQKQFQHSLTLESIEQDLARRDRSDMNRKVNPLVVPPDAIVIDTSNLTLNQTVERIIEIFGEKTHV